MPVSSLLVVHGTAGAVALLAGTVAAAVRKGGRLHARAGNMFTVAMLGLAGSGVWLALRKAETGNLVGGLLTLYMVATAWTAGRSANGRAGAGRWGVLDGVAMVFALAVAGAILWYGVLVSLGRPGGGVPAGMDFFLGGVLLLAAAGDARMLWRGGIHGRARIARHLWRMCFALFEASGSFFMGRQRFFPVAVQRSGVLLALTVLPLGVLLFWMVRVRRGWPKGSAGALRDGTLRDGTREATLN